MKTKYISLVLLIVLIFSSCSINASSMNTSEISTDESAKLTITVDYIEEIDPVEGMGHTDAPEWYFIIKVQKSTSDYSNPEIWQKSWDDPKENGKWDVKSSKDFSARYNQIPIQIELKESDIFPDEDETADLSGLKGDNPSDIDGKIFDCIYHVSTETIEVKQNEKIQGPDSEGYYIICGEFDGRGTPGPQEDNPNEDDARMRFKIEDNIDDFEVTLSIKDFTGNKIIPGQDITFICTLTGGVPPFEYNFIPRYRQDHTIISEEKEERTYEKTLSYNNVDHGYYNPYIFVSDNIGLSAVFEMDTIIVNRPPDKPSKPVFNTLVPGVSYSYETSGTDPDGDYIQYQYKYYKEKDSNPIKTDWQDSNIHYADMRYYKTYVRLRDDPNRDNNFADGFVTEWSEPLSKEKTDYNYENLNILEFVYFSPFFKIIFKSFFQV